MPGYGIYTRPGQASGDRYRHPVPSSYKILLSNIGSTELLKVIGVEISDNLSWNNHIKESQPRQIGPYVLNTTSELRQLADKQGSSLPSEYCC